MGISVRNRTLKPVVKQRAYPTNLCIHMKVMARDKNASKQWANLSH